MKKAKRVWAILTAACLLATVPEQAVFAAETETAVETETTVETETAMEAETVQASVESETELPEETEAEETKVLLEEGETDEWLSKMDYKILPADPNVYPYEDHVEITRVYGSQEIEIPGSAMVDGQVYKVALGRDCLFRNRSSKLTLGEGLILRDKETILDEYSTYSVYLGSSSYLTLDGCDLGEAAELWLGTDMEFGGGSINQISIRNMDMSKLTSMRHLFSYNYNMLSVSMKNLDMSNVTNMEDAFYWCRRLNSITLENLKTDSLEDMSSMFSTCYQLKTVDVSTFNTSNVKDMSGMFYDCKALKSLDLSTFDTSKVEDMHAMFAKCPNIKRLDLSSWELPCLQNADNMFKDTLLLTLKTPKNTGCAIPLPATYYDLETGIGYTEIPAGLDHSLNLSLYSAIPVLSQVKADTDSIMFSWAPEEDGSYYEVFKLDNSSGKVTKLGVTQETSFTDDDVVYGKIYTYLVLAFPTSYGAYWVDTVDMGLGTSFSPVNWFRLAGTDRYDTMAKITAEGFKTQRCDKIIVARGDNFADALTASALAGKWKCPIITTPPDMLSDEARAEIERIAKNSYSIQVYVIGGEKAVKNSVVERIGRISHVRSVERISGDDRIDTALSIYYMAIDSNKPWDQTCIVVNGFSFADALSIGPYAYASRVPIFPTDKNGCLTAAEIKIIQNNFSKIIICGGSAAVKSESVKKVTGKRYQRLAGETRYETSLEIAKWASGNRTGNVFGPYVKLNLNGTAVTNAMNYPDALVAVNLAGIRRNPLLLVSENSRSKKAIEELGRLGMNSGYILGGKAAVSETVAKWLTQ